MVNSTYGYSFLPAMFDPRLQRTHMNIIEWLVSNVFDQVIKPINIIVKTPFVLIFQHELCSRLFKCSLGPYSVNYCLPNFLHQPR